MPNPTTRRMNLTSSRTRRRSTARRAAALLLSSTVALGLSACAGGPDRTDLVMEQQAAPSSSSTLGSLGDCSAGVNPADSAAVTKAMADAWFSEQISVTNNSNVTLRYAGLSSASEAVGHFIVAPQDLPPGRTQIIQYCSNNVGGGEVEMYYKHDKGNGGVATLKGFFQVPSTENNQWGCGADNADVIASGKKACTETWGGNHAKFQWTISANPATASFPTLVPGKFWTFHPYNQPTVELTVGSNPTADDGQPVSFLDAAGTSAYAGKWIWLPAHDGWGMLKNSETGKCLEQNGTDGSVDVWTCQQQDNLLWRPSNDGRFLELARGGWLGGKAGEPAIIQHQGENLTALSAS